jgi:hypothetical protein
MKWAWTDKNGNFTAEGLYQELWYVHAHIFDPEGMANLRPVPVEKISALGPLPIPQRGVYLGQLVLKPASPNPYTLDFVMHTGEVTGKVCDGHTGKPLDEEIWKIFADVSFRHDPWKMKRWCYVGEKDSRFRIICVPEGELQLAVIVPGYLYHYSKPFRLEQGEKKDLGEIPLFPSGGILDLKVKDPEGRILTDYEVCNLGDPSGMSPIYKMHVSPGRMRITGLPAQKVTFSVLTENYEPQKMTVELKPKIPVKVDMVLEYRQEGEPAQEK